MVNYPALFNHCFTKTVKVNLFIDNYAYISCNHPVIGCRVSFQRSEYNKNIERRLYMLFYRITNCLSHINIYL